MEGDGEPLHLYLMAAAIAFASAFLIHTFFPMGGRETTWGLASAWQ